jgi:hypothetical protein
VVSLAGLKKTDLQFMTSITGNPSETLQKIAPGDGRWLETIF